MASSLTPAAFAAIPFDYILVGGGTAGLAVATRLSENASSVVGVIEAGGDHTTDLAILVPGLALTALGNPEYDWSFQTTPQAYADGRVIGHPRGKQLGGSSAINLYYWTHASQTDLNDWGALGNSGWSWDEVNPYYTKSENFSPPSQAVSDQVDTENINVADHGTSGPIQNTLPPFYDDFFKTWEPSFQSIGLGPTGDPRDGLAIGAFNGPVNQDHVNASRCYSANAYWKPNSLRPNLHVLTASQVTKINFALNETPLRATGVNFVSGGSKYTAQVSGEVILSAGVFQSPQILELSGIGNSSLLSENGIDVLYDNPNVGENLQDHLLVPLAFETAEAQATLQAFRNETLVQLALAEWQFNHTGPLAASSGDAYISFTQAQNVLNGPSNTSQAQQTIESLYGSGYNGQQGNLTLQKLMSPSEAAFQFVYIPGGSSPANSTSWAGFFNTDLNGSYITISTVLEHPFSRGSVHITTGDPLAYPAINPNYLEHPLDAYVAGQGVLLAQKIARSGPLSALLKENGTVFQPAFYELNDENVEVFVKQNFGTEAHPMSSCSMLPRNQGGVVDERFHVYGTSNVRVVDASIFPMAVRGNLQTLVYAIAERASDFIKADAQAGQTRRG